MFLSLLTMMILHEQINKVARFTPKGVWCFVWCQKRELYFSMWVKKGTHTHTHRERERETKRETAREKQQNPKRRNLI